MRLKVWPKQSPQLRERNHGCISSRPEIRHPFSVARQRLCHNRTSDLFHLIAANTALFAIVNSVILNPLPVPEANSILIRSNDYPKAGATGGNNSSSGDYFDRLKEMTVFESQAVFRSRNQTVELNGSPQQIRGMLGTPSRFKLLRVSPAVGRAFTEKKGEIGND
jgi:putative ABC transport system permease protein